ncbi:MAG: hypothetical protein ACRC7N_17880 [Clostridium sp.]
MASLANTQTLENLVSVLVRESKVSASYSLYSKTALAEGFYDISEIFSRI